MIQQQSKVFLCLGANLGERLLTLQKTVKALNAIDFIDVVKVSSVYETEPWGMIEQPRFLNVAAEIETVLEPLELLHELKNLERRLGRTPGMRWGPRIVDIDIILWDGLQFHTDELTIPHIYFRERHFVLAPLAEIAPEAIDPITGFTVGALLDNLSVKALVPCADINYS